MTRHSQDSQTAIQTRPDPGQTSAGRHEDNAQTRPDRTRPAIIATAIALGAVVVAPVLLSSQDLYNWAADPYGLGLHGVWPLLVPLAMDFAAVAMIGMTIAAAIRRERPGVFELLIWIFAGISAYAQYKHGTAVRDAGGAQDAWWAFPALALLGPVLLHVTLSRLRMWARKDAGEQFHGAAGFGHRWLPGVAFRQTLRAWAASRREGINSAADAIAYVREVDALSSLTPVDSLHYAFGALGTFEPHAARVWLAARGTVIDQATIDAVCAGRPASPVPAIERPAPGPAQTDTPDHAEQLARLDSKRARIRYAFSHLGRADAPAAMAWLAEHGVTVSRAEAYTVAKQSGEQDTEQDTESGSRPGLSVLRAG